MYFEKIKQNYEIGDVDLRTLSPVVLAYIGDAVYDVIIRCMLVLKSREQVDKLHKSATAYVKAQAQKDIVEKILDDMNEEELGVYKRARNAKQHAAPKNASLADYHKATGFEAVIGYLYLKGEEDRIFELLNKGICY